MIGRELSEVKNDLAALRKMFDQTVTHAEFRRSDEDYMEHLNIALDQIVRIEKTVYNLQEDWNRWEEANHRGKRSSPESCEVIQPVAPHTSGADEWGMPAVCSTEAREVRLG